MSIPITFKITQEGQSALFNANNTGVELNITHIQFGSGNRTPAGSETGLITPEQAVAIAFGSKTSATQIRMTANFTGEITYDIKEIGIWSGDPLDVNSVLFCYWSQPSGKIATKYAGVDFLFSHEMSVDAASPTGGVNIVYDENATATLAAIIDHTNGADPHPQYMTSAEVSAVLGNSASRNVGTTSGTVCDGNDGRLSNARAPTTHNHASDEITGLPVFGVGNSDMARGNHTHPYTSLIEVKTEIANIVKRTVLASGHDGTFTNPYTIGAAGSGADFINVTTLNDFIAKDYYVQNPTVPPQLIETMTGEHIAWFKLISDFSLSYYIELYNNSAIGIIGGDTIDTRKKIIAKYDPKTAKWHGQCVVVGGVSVLYFRGYIQIEWDINYFSIDNIIDGNWVGTNGIYVQSSSIFSHVCVTDYELANDHLLVMKNLHNGIISIGGSNITVDSISFIDVINAAVAQYSGEILFLHKRTLGFKYHSQGRFHYDFTNTTKSYAILDISYPVVFSSSKNSNIYVNGVDVTILPNSTLERDYQIAHVWGSQQDRIHYCFLTTEAASLRIDNSNCYIKGAAFAFYTSVSSNAFVSASTFVCTNIGHLLVVDFNSSWVSIDCLYNITKCNQMLAADNFSNIVFRNWSVKPSGIMYNGNNVSIFSSPPINTLGNLSSYIYTSLITVTNNNSLTIN